jgi:hypothetical protein
MLNTIPVTRRNRFFLASIIALTTGLACYVIQVRFERGAGDLGYITRLFVDLINGIDPYSYPTSLTPMSYPLTAALAMSPFAALPPELAAGVFFGLSSGLLVMALTRNGHWWMLLVLLAMPYWQALLTVQLSPLLLATAFYPVLLPLTLCKPTIGFPLAMTRLTWPRAFACAAFVIVSLLIMPDWPLRWLGHQADPGQYIPPLLTLPFGPFLLLALYRWRDSRAWFLVLLAAMPQRQWYDMLLIFVVAQTPRQILALVAGTWLAFWGWRLFFPQLADTLVILCVYYPALFIVLKGAPNNVVSPVAIPVQETSA